MNLANTDNSGCSKAGARSLKNQRRRVVNRFFLILFTALTTYACTAEKDAADLSKAKYRNPSLPIAVRVDDLIQRMTLAEKISQLYNESPAIERLQVPYYDWWNEALHGVARAGKATVYPQAIGLAATFNRPLVHQVAASISDEARAKHHYFIRNNVISRYTGLTFWSPNVNIFRDPRWGRGQETYGEDPFLTGSLAVAFIQGLQGDDEHYLKTAAMAKHFAVHSGPEKSRHADDYHVSLKDLHETYLPAFAMAVKDAKVESIMCAYNRVNGDPACGNDFLLKDILRRDWGFGGHVVSDCGALADFYDPLAHNLVKAPAAAAAWALKSGTDLNCGTSRLSTFTNLHFALQKNMVTTADIDRALSRLLTTRFKLGMFDPPEQVPFANIAMSVVGSPKHLQLTQQAAEESLVLVKNNGVLPLNSNRKIAVIGPNATNPSALVGNYHGDPIAPVTPLQGIIDIAGAQNVSFAPGSAIIGNHYGHYAVVPEQYFSHKNQQGDLQPGLMADYYAVASDGNRVPVPSISRIDRNIDFYWQTSPLDGSVWGQFAVTWQGYLQVPVSGKYQFATDADIVIDGNKVKQPIDLQTAKRYPFSAKISYHHNWRGDNDLEPKVQLRWLNTAENLAQQAVDIAKTCDVIVFVSGISPEIEGEEMPVEFEGFDRGDRVSIGLPKEQTQLLKTLKALGKPIVLVNLSGSAMALTWENDHLDAILQGFYPGEATGKALANLLFGMRSPSAKLPVTFYRDSKDLPDFKDYSMANRTYKFFRGQPLFPFGHGLSYSQFQFSVNDTKKTDDNQIEVRYSLVNSGLYPAAEVSQLYMDLPDSAEHTAARELIAYRKDHLAAQARQEFSLYLDAKQISYVDTNGVRQPYRGRVRFSLGGGQPGFKGSSNVVEWDWQYEN